MTAPGDRDDPDARLIEAAADANRPIPELDSEEVAILRALVQSGTAMTQIDVAVATNLSRGTVGTRIHGLRLKKLVAYPEGKSKLTVATPEAHRVLKKLGSA